MKPIKNTVKKRCYISVYMLKGKKISIEGIASSEGLTSTAYVNRLIDADLTKRKVK